MTLSLRHPLILLAMLLVTGAIARAARAADAPAAPTTAPSPIDPKADAALKAMSKLLAGTKSFTFDAHAVRQQMTESGQKVEFARNQKVSVRRPDAIAVSLVGDQDDMEFRYDGRTVTLLNRTTKACGKTDMQGDLDKMFDSLMEKFGMSLPLADIVFSDPYKSLTGQARSGKHLGTGHVFQTKCHHLAFRQEAIDWEIWIEEGDNPVPHKLVITYKDSPGHLQFTAYFSNWNLKANLPDAAFKIEFPADVKVVTFTEPATAPADKR